MSPDSEHQLHQLRFGLKLLACLVSPLLTLRLYTSVGIVLQSREIYADLGAALPGLMVLLTGQPLLLRILPAFSLAAFLAILLLSLRGRGSAFLVVFAVSLFLHLLVLWLLGLAADLPLRALMQGLA